MPHPDVTVRVATADDAGRLAELLHGGALTAKEDPGDAGPYADALDEIIATPGNDVLVAELDGRLVGMCQLLVFRHIQERGGRCAEVESVHVDAALRSTGVGTALMADVVERARAAGCYRVQLTSNLARPDAHRWYARLGFTGSHTGFKRYLPGPDGDADPVVGTSGSVGP
jgi:GNAT superfamily N-acetyltransferase